jgi:hypothetical protein
VFRQDLRIHLSAEHRVFSVVLAPVAAAGWIVLALTRVLVGIALFREHRTQGVVSALWAVGFALFLWAGVAVLGVPELRAIPFALVAGVAIGLVVYLRGAALEDVAFGQPGAYHLRLLARRRSGPATRVSYQTRPERTRELDLARIKLGRGELREALFPLKEAERVAMAQRKLNELLEVRELVRVLTERSSGRTQDESERLARKVDEHVQAFPAEELTAVGIPKEPSREELDARFAREQLESRAGGRPPVTTPELTMARTALDSGEFRTALYHLEEARRVAVAQGRFDELLEVYALTRALSERSDGRAHSASARLIRKVEAGMRSFAPSA